MEGAQVLPLLRPKSAPLFSSSSSPSPPPQPPSLTHIHLHDAVSWLPSHPPSQRTFAIRKIDSPTQRPPSPLFYTSDPPGILNLSNIASARTSFSLPASSVPTVTTASPQQTWLPSPRSTSAPSPNTNKIDFQLFPDPPAHPLHQGRQLAPPPPGLTYKPTQGKQYYSAPYSTPSFRPQRPPVPLFNAKSTGTIPILQTPSTLAKMDDFVTSFDGSLDASFGAGFDVTDSLSWDSSLANFTAVNAGTVASSCHTVSPQELFNDFVASAPASAALTNLTSPDMGESPYIACSTEVSPMFHSMDDFGNPEQELWPSLFSGELETTAPVMQRNDSNVSSDSASNNVVSLDQHNFRRKSSGSNGASPGHQRQSSVNGVKPRRRKAVLPSITVDANDKAGLKRARNTLAARVSRDKKAQRLDDLEARVQEMEAREQLFKTALAEAGYNGPLLHE